MDDFAQTRVAEKQYLEPGSEPVCLAEQCNLFFQPVAELFDHRVGQHLTCYPLNLSFGGFLFQRAIKLNLEKLSLADLRHALVAHLLESAVDRLALWIKDSRLQHHRDMGFHGMNRIIGEQSALSNRPKLP